MGHHCTTDICKNVLFIGSQVLEFESFEEKAESNEEFEEYMKNYGSDLEFHLPDGWKMLTCKEQAILWPGLVRGITFDDLPMIYIGKKKRVYLEYAFEKDGHYVWVQNVDEASNADGYTFIACGPDRKGVEMFAQDLGLDPSEIEDEDTVEQWG